MSQDKVAAVQDWPTPRSVRNVQSFLGLYNYYRRFIRAFAKIAQPLMDLTRKEVLFNWTQKCNIAFNDLKQRLTSTPILQVFDPALDTEVWCDASAFAVRATLVQCAPDRKQWLPVEFMSKRLSAAECNYNATEREFVVLRSALERWRHYLLGRRFVV